MGHAIFELLYKINLQWETLNFPMLVLVPSSCYAVGKPTIPRLCKVLRTGLDEAAKKFGSSLNVFASTIRTINRPDGDWLSVRIYFVSTLMREIRQQNVTISYRLPEGCCSFEDLAISPCGQIIGYTCVEGTYALFTIGLFGGAIKTRADGLIVGVSTVAAGFWRVVRLDDAGEPVKQNYAADGGEFKIMEASLDVVPVDQFKRPGNFEMAAVGLYILTFGDMSQYAYTAFHRDVLVTEGFNTLGELPDHIKQLVTPNGAVVFYNLEKLEISVQFLPWKHSRTILTFELREATAATFPSITIECVGKIILLTNLAGWAIVGTNVSKAKPLAFATEKTTNSIVAILIE